MVFTRINNEEDDTNEYRSDNIWNRDQRVNKLEAVRSYLDWSEQVDKANVDRVTLDTPGEINEEIV
jgi:hypothetical protein